MDIWKSLAAGAAASLVSKAIVELLKLGQSSEIEAQENWAEIKSAEGVLVDRVARRLHAQLSPERREKAVDALHLAAGTLGGAAANRARLRAVARRPMLGGVLWGVGMWALLDLVVKPFIGITRGPLALPWQTHARRLGGLVSYAMTRTKVAGLLHTT